MDESLLAAMRTHGRVDRQGLADESFHFRVAASWPLVEVAPAPGAAFGHAATQQGSVVAACDATADEQSAIEGLDLSDHPFPA